MLLLLIAFFTLFNCSANPDFKLGLENISDTFLHTLNPTKPLTIGLITNQTGKDQQGRSNIQLLQERGITIKYLFAPEHGITGKKVAAATIHDSHDVQHNIPIVSLYKNGSGTTIRDQCLQEVDALFFDIQDSGMRHYTYISTLFYALECAALHNKPIIVLDRPNPLGNIMEGPLVEPPLKSFISIAEIPLRHGMTVGELAYFFNTYTLTQPANLYIIPMKNYERAHAIGCTISTALSPNITCTDACYGYSFLGLLGEVKPFHVGVGTKDAFQIITLPTTLNIAPASWQTLQKKLLENGITSTALHTIHPKKRKEYYGLRLHIPNINEVSSFATLLTILEWAKEQGAPLEFSTTFDKAAGTTKVREYVTGKASKQELCTTVNAQSAAFMIRAQTVLKYQPYPVLKSL